MVVDGGGELVWCGGGGGGSELQFQFILFYYEFLGMSM